MARMRLSKEEYDQLYYYVNGKVAEYWVVERGVSPLRYTSPRRYDTLDAVRRAALAKSRKLWKENEVLKEVGLPTHCPILWVYKGERFLGTVCHDILRCFDGIWCGADCPKDDVALKKDGTLY